VASPQLKYPSIIALTQPLPTYGRREGWWASPIDTLLKDSACSRRVSDVKKKPSSFKKYEFYEGLDLMNY